MSRYGRWVMVVVLFSFIALSATAAESLKIGTVDFQKVLNSVEQGKRAKDQLKREFDARQQKIDLQREDLKRIKDDFDKQKLALSESAVREKEKQFNDKLMDMQKNVASYQQELAGKEMKMTQSILQNMRVIVAEIGKSEKFTLVVEKSQDAVVYAESSQDLTDRVVSQYNKRYTGSLNLQ